MSATQTQTIDRDDYEVFGWRFVDQIVSIGQSLDISQDWDTGDDLSGTCAFESRGMCEDYAKNSDGWIIEVGGSDLGWGNLAGERIIGNAEVVSVETILSSQRKHRSTP